MPHRVLNDKRMTFPQNLMQNMAELPRRYAILLQRLTNGDCPEGMASVRVISADYRSANMFGLHRRFESVESFANARRQLVIFFIS